MNAQQLRNSILQQAIQGKLVTQDPNDEPASVLLQRIRKEKERLVKEGKLKKKDLESKPIEEDEIPFEIPESWKWVRFGTITINRDCERIPLSVDERSKLKKKYDYYGASGVIDKVDRFLFNKPLLLIGEDGANLINRSTPIAFIAKGEYWVNNHAHVLDYCDEDLMQYVCWYINSISLVEYVTGTAQPKMNQEKMNSILVALPPLAEQRRIVAKIEELMSLVERYGKAQQALDQLNESLPARLRQSILQEAIQGRLVPQDPKEEPASELLKRILTTVNKTSTKKKILTKIKEEDMPENIVDGWEYFYIKDVFFTTSGGTPIKGHPDYYGGDIPWVKSGELNNKYLYDSEQKITELGLKNSSAKFFPIDTVAIAMYGATIGKTSIFKKEMTTNQAICGIFPVEGILPEYIYYFLIAKKQDFCSQAFGGAQPNISQEKIKNTVFPLPPLSEQKRIVAKVEELFGVMG